MFNKKSDIDQAKRLFDADDDKLAKGNGLQRIGGGDALRGVAEEPLGAADDDVDFDVGGKSIGSGAGK